MGNKKLINFTVDENGCFICTSHAGDKDGYPKIFVNHTPYRGHRFVYEQCFGEIPDGLIVRHKCDNPGCINPEHLELGTFKDNAIDRSTRGRGAPQYGEHNPNSKLTTNKVIAIKRDLKNGLSWKDIAAKYGTTVRNVENICRGYSWRHVSLEEIS